MYINSSSLCYSPIIIFSEKVPVPVKTKVVDGESRPRISITMCSILFKKTLYNQTLRAVKLNGQTAF